MPNEINFAYQAGASLYAFIKNAHGLFYNAKAHWFEAFAGGHWASYAVPLVEIGATTPPSGQYTASMPLITISGVYTIDIYKQEVGISQIADGPPVGTGEINWDGRSLVEISLADMIGVPAIFGTVAPSPIPNNTIFTVDLDKSINGNPTPDSFHGMFLTCMPGGQGGAPFGQSIVQCSINSPKQISVTLLLGLPVAPVAGDPVAISG